MNENLSRLMALVKETNEVVNNLRNETNEIEENNVGARAKKFIKIRDYLLECYEIANELNICIKVPLFFLDEDKELYINFNAYDRHNGRRLKVAFNTNDHGYRGSWESISSSHSIDENTVWKTDWKQQFIFSCYAKIEDENRFIDTWNQDEFEKKFAAEVEKEIIKRANEANEKYNDAMNSSEMLKGRN